MFRRCFVLVLAVCIVSDSNNAVKLNKLGEKDFSYGSWTPMSSSEKDHMIRRMDHEGVKFPRSSHVMTQSPRQARKTDKPPGGKNKPGEVLRLAAEWAAKRQTPAEDRQYTPPGPAYGAPPPPPPPAPENCYLETPCTRSCGDGFKLLLPNPDGQACYGAALQVFPCNLAHCPVDCVWGPWAPWSPCAPAPHHPHSIKRQRRSAKGKSDGVGGHGHHPRPSNTFFGAAGVAQVAHHGDHHPPPLAPSSGPFCGQGRSRAIDRPAGYGGILCIGEPVEQRFCMSLQCLGPQGPIGHVGAAGIPGTNGHPGQDGRPGDRGPNGVDGRQGPPGTAGRDGTEGKPGPQGPPGVEGKVGENGPPGAMGPAGAQGLTGAPGPRGRFGEIGPEGPEGPIGISGPSGKDGNPGVGGPAGPPGLDGHPGQHGPMGPVGSAGEQGLTGAPGPRGLQGPKGAGVYHHPPPPPPPPIHAPLPSYQSLPPPPPPAQFQNSPQFSVPQSAFFPNKKREAPFTNPSTLQQSQFSSNNVRVTKGNKGNYNKGTQKRENQKKWSKKVNKGQENQRGRGWNTVTKSNEDSKGDDWEPSHTKTFNKGSTFGSNSGFNKGSSFSKIVRGPDVGNQDFTDSGEPGTFVETFEITTKLSSPNNKNNRNKNNKNNKQGGRRSSRRNHN